MTGRPSWCQPHAWDTMSNSSKYHILAGTHLIQLYKFVCTIHTQNGTLFTDGCCVFCLYCEAWSCRCSCMGSVSVSLCRCYMFVCCVHPVAVLNAAFCTTCSF